MIAYIDMYRDQFGVELICRTLAAREGGFITSRGYRAAKTRPACERQIRDRELTVVIKDLHARNYGDSAAFAKCGTRCAEAAGRSAVTRSHG